jgi:hypothetical protein
MKYITCTLRLLMFSHLESLACGVPRGGHQGVHVPLGASGLAEGGGLGSPPDLPSATGDEAVHTEASCPPIPSSS